MTKDDYLREIRYLESVIEDCYGKIRLKNDQIEELQLLVKRMRTLSTTMTEAADNAQRRMGFLESLMNLSYKARKGRFFLEQRSIYKGAHYKKANEGIKQIIKKNYYKIDDLEEVIRDLKKRIRQYEGRINECYDEIRRLEKHPTSGAGFGGGGGGSR